MASCFDKKYADLWREYAQKFPDSDWGYEGCGLDDGRIIALLQESLNTGVDRLTESYPIYSSDAVIA